MKKISANKKRQIIDLCQQELREVEQILQSYGALFRMADRSEIEENFLSGLGISLNQLSQKIDRSCESLNEIY